MLRAHSPSMFLCPVGVNCLTASVSLSQAKDCRDAMQVMVGEEGRMAGDDEEGQEGCLEEDEEDVWRRMKDEGRTGRNQWRQELTYT